MVVTVRCVTIPMRPTKSNVIKHLPHGGEHNKNAENASLTASRAHTEVKHSLKHEGLLGVLEVRLLVEMEESEERTHNAHDINRR